MSRYAFTYAVNTVYENVVALATEHFIPGGVVLDVGCGHGAVAEPLRDLGFRYVGVDLDASGLEDLTGRGFATTVCDVTDPASVERLSREYLDGEALAGILLIDCLEHVVDGVGLLSALRRVAERHDDAPLVVSVPNVGHVDLGIKLLMGRWDYTETGLLDDTHVAFFDERRIEAVFAESGWLLTGRRDFMLDRSDQHFPSDAVTLEPATTVSALLRQLRDRAPGAEVNQWVRSYRPTQPEPAEAESAGDSRTNGGASDPGEPPFLSVLTRTQGHRLETLQETLLCLAAQSDADFEVLVLAHAVSPERLGDIRYLIDILPESVARRVRLIPVAGGGRCRPLNVGVEQARGRYVAVLDDDDLVLGHWVESLHQLADRWPGRVVRGRVASQDIERMTLLGRDSHTPVSAVTTPYPRDFDLLDHIVENRTPPCGLAFPRSVFRDLNVRFDESLPVLEDWDVLLQAASWCGTAGTPDVIAIYRRWQAGESSSTVHPPTEWAAAHSAIIAKLDNHVQLLPRGSLARIRDLYQEVETAHADTRREIETTLAVARHRDDQLRIIDNLNGDNTALRVHVAHLETLIESERADRASDIEKALDGARIQVRDEVRQEFWSSTSWRATRPLRVLSRIRRRLYT